jgi:hypothetical protein
MTGIAYGVFTLPSDKELEEETWQRPLLERIEAIEQQLFVPFPK